MTRYSDSNYLLGQQYRDSSNLDARVALHERFDTNPQKWQPWVFDQLDLPAEARCWNWAAVPAGCGATTPTASPPDGA